MKTIRIVLADDHNLVRAGIRALLERLPNVQVVGEAEDGRVVQDLVRKLKPDVVLMDIGMPGLNGLDATSRLNKDFPDIHVIILSMHSSEEYIWQAFKAGASGYLLKKSATAELAAALKKVMDDEIYLSESLPVRPQEVNPQKLDEQKSPLDVLNSRQREVLQLIAEGRNTKEIALILSLSTKTVEYHRGQLMERLHIHDIPGLVRFALRVGLIPAEPLEPR